MFFFLAIKGDSTENSYRNYLRRRKDFSEKCKAPFVWVSKALTCHGEVLEDWPAVKWIMNKYWEVDISKPDYVAEYNSKSLFLWKNKTIIMFLHVDDAIRILAVCCFYFLVKKIEQFIFRICFPLKRFSGSVYGFSHLRNDILNDSVLFL